MIPYYVVVIRRQRVFRQAFAGLAKIGKDEGSDVSVETN